MGSEHHRLYDMSAESGGQLTVRIDQRPNSRAHHRCRPTGSWSRGHRSASGTWPSTCSTCAPQPAQVGLPHCLHVTSLHMPTRLRRRGTRRTCQGRAAPVAAVGCSGDRWMGRCVAWMPAGRNPSRPPPWSAVGCGNGSLVAAGPARRLRCAPGDHRRSRARCLERSRRTASCGRRGANHGGRHRRRRSGCRAGRPDRRRRTA